ncbi:ubiquitin carboxyl-terminal hydrolase MINDY-1 isoform X2 [Camarhynchus parvulus]|uniref:ubiquitin carboxyl-terminal hydrolase MINDY-1 isoform X2 n=1 Tax=Geospiza parvula TaxID=87175 RepID=UPI001237D13D|nr:ubiquitin carboxyl-terminal hydrolase MINDY-1 isoform X2 [Camarhynchus parvulus]
MEQEGTPEPPEEPAGGDGIPNVGHGIPSVGDGNSNVGDAIPGVGRGISGVADGIPSVGDRIPSVGDRIPNVGDEVPSVGDGIPNVGDEVPNVGDGIPNVGDEVPNVGDGIPSVGDAIPNVGDAIPNVGAGDGIPDVADAIPSVEDEIPGAGDKIPSVEDTIPGVGDTIPNVGDTIPSVGDTIPSVGDTIPNFRDGIPGLGDTLPNVGDTIPNFRDGIPGAGHGIPDVGDTIPGAGDRIPGAGNSQEGSGAPSGQQEGGSSPQGPPGGSPKQPQPPQDRGSPKEGGSPKEQPPQEGSLKEGGPPQDRGSPPAEPPRAQPPGDFYFVKWILWKGQRTALVTQGENGPCPLLAIINILLLQWKVKLPPQTEVVTAEELMAHLGNCILATQPRDTSEGLQLNFQQNINDTMTVLPKLSTGLDVNVRFTGVSDFEYTPECIVFDLLNIPLYHGWLVDPQSPEQVQAVGKLSYNQLVEKIITCKHASDSRLVSEGLVAEQFLESTASQLTFHGLCELMARAREGELGVFFRNNHFSTMTKHKDFMVALSLQQGQDASSVLSDLELARQLQQEEYQQHHPHRHPHHPAPAQLLPAQAERRPRQRPDSDCTLL